MEYAVPVLNPYLRIQKLESVQRFAVKVCLKRWNVSYINNLNASVLMELAVQRSLVNYVIFVAHFLKYYLKTI